MEETLNGSTFGKLRSFGLYDLQAKTNNTYLVNMARPMLYSMLKQLPKLSAIGRIEISRSTQDTHGDAIERAQLYSFVASAGALKHRIEDALTPQLKGMTI